MSKFNAWAFCLFFIPLASSAAAEPLDDAAQRARQIAPFIDEQTLAVFRAGMSGLTAEPLINLLVQLVPGLSGEREKIREQFQRVQQAFRQAGATSWYAVFSLAEPSEHPPFVPQREPLIVIPAPPAVEERPIRELLRAERALAWRVEHRGDVLLVASGATVERLKTFTPNPRPALADAFRASGDAAIQILFLPPSYAGRVIEELMPELPEALGGGPSTVLTRGLRWAAVGIDFRPQVQLRAVVQSESQKAAEALRGKWLQLLRLLLAQEDAKPKFRDFARASELLTPKVEGSRLVLNVSQHDRSLDALLAALRPPIQAARTQAERTQSINNLLQLALAMHNYHAVYNTFPPAGSTDGQGQPLLSWRVLLLPFVEQQKLYDQFRLDEPWDSPHNRKLIDKMPEVFKCPASKLSSKQGLATYRVVSGERTVFPPGKALPIKEIKDGTSNTIMIVEVDDRHAVIWTKPEGLPFDPDNPARGLGGQFAGGFNAAFCDGSVRFISDTIAAKVLRALLTRDGQEVIPSPSQW